MIWKFNYNKEYGNVAWKFNHEEDGIRKLNYQEGDESRKLTTSRET